MKKTSKLLSLFVLVISGAACSRLPEPATLLSQESSFPETKVVQLGQEYSRSSFLVKLQETPTPELLESLSGNGIAGFRPLFQSFPGKENVERKYGLDRWFVVDVAEGHSLERTLSSIAASEHVALAEYACIAHKESDERVFPAQEVFYTKAKAESRFNDPMFPSQWHYDNQGSKEFSSMVVKGADVNVKDVWSTLTCGDPDIIVAVVDEGVKWSHPDLRDNMWTNPGEVAGNGIDDDGNGYVDDVYGFNFVANGPISWDKQTVIDGEVYGDKGHGTHCAGTIAAVNNNGKGVAGVAGGSGKGDGCRIMSCQVFSGTDSGSGGIEATVRAIKYAADMGASVISCSFGYKSAFASDNAYMSRIGSAEIDVIHYFEDAQNSNNPVLDGNIAIFAAGNEAHNYAHYPGAFYDIISVSSFAPDYLPAYYTNYGPGCNISAPGGEYYHGVGEKSMILSTLPSELYSSDYGYMQGTSMACPHMSGVVALGLSYAKQLGKKYSVNEFKQILLASCDDIDQRIASTDQKNLQGHAAVKMAPYYHQMGTGAIDAWRLMMHIEGLPTLTSEIGKSQWIDLTSAFGTASVSLTYLSVEVPEATVQSLGLQKIEPTNTGKYPATVDANGYAYVQFGRLYVSPTKVGSGKIKISAVGGGDHLGGGSNPPGGMALAQEVSLIARDVPGGNGTGGWL